MSLTNRTIEHQDLHPKTAAQDKLFHSGQFLENAEIHWIFFSISSPSVFSISTGWQFYRDKKNEFITAIMKLPTCILAVS